MIYEYLFLAFYCVFTSIHLYATKKKERLLRGSTKGYILFSLLAFYIVAMMNKNQEPSILVILAIIFSFIGDMFLIPKGTKWFAIGGIAFLISHIFFVLSYATYTDFNNVPIIAIILILVAFVSATVVIFTKLKKYLPKALFYPMFFYLVCNGTMNSFAIFRLIAGVDLTSIITVIGAILFFISDTSLFFVRFNKDSVMKTHFLVMITYSIAELLIVLGFVL